MRKWLPNQRKCSLHVTSRMCSEQRCEETQSTEPGDGAWSWAVFANLWAGKQGVQPTAWTNTPEGCRPLAVRDGLLHGACEAPVAFALALRVAMKEFDEEMRKQGVGWTTELECWAYVDDITIATTARLAPLVTTKLRETLEEHGLELWKDKCTAYCPTPERAECIREEMTQFLKWTPEGLMKRERPATESTGRKSKKS